MSAHYASWLAPNFERFIAVKRAGGASYKNQAGHLAAFDRYLVEREVRAPLSRDALCAFVSKLDRLSPRGRDNVISVVWQALSFARLHDAPIDQLPARPAKAPVSFRVREPRIVSLEEFRAVGAQARRFSGLRAIDACRGATYSTLFGLLFVTGMRISEALALDEGDLGPETGLVTIRCGKFGKPRVLPVQPCTLAALQRFVADPRRPSVSGPAKPLFVSSMRRRLSYTAARSTFEAACRRAGLDTPRPRLHDLRHSFAVLSVAAWYRDRRDINALLPVLSAYLGHASVQNTRVYLRQNGLLLEHACRRFASATDALDEVLA